MLARVPGTASPGLRVGWLRAATGNSSEVCTELPNWIAVLPLIQICSHPMAESIDPFAHLLSEARRYDAMADACTGKVAETHSQTARDLRRNWRSNQSETNAASLVIYYSKKFDCRAGFCRRMDTCARNGRCLDSFA